MASNTKNVKIGVCRVSFAGVDLGYTKGGVEVTVKTDTHKTEVDQFGKTAIKETIMGREVGAKVPMAETTLENLIATMPGSTLNVTGGSAATGTIEITTNLTANQTIVVNGVTITAKVLAAGADEVTIGATAAETAVNLAAVLNASYDLKIAAATYAVATDIVTITYGNALIFGTSGAKTVEGNSFTLDDGTAGASVTLSGATLSGGTNSTSKKVNVNHGVGVDLLDIARPLRLHPVNKAADDLSEDFVIPLAATAGALTFAYKLEDERVYNVEFMGYPDSVTGDLFYIGE